MRQLLLTCNNMLEFLWAMARTQSQSSQSPVYLEIVQSLVFPAAALHMYWLCILIRTPVPMPLFFYTVLPSSKILCLIHTSPLLSYLIFHLSYSHLTYHIFFLTSPILTSPITSFFLTFRDRKQPR